MLKKVLLFLLLCFACNTEYFSRIPNSAVILKLDVNLTDTKLNPVLGYDTYTQLNGRVLAMGFAGILVIHGYEDFYAYDMACPYEVSRSAIVAVTGSYQAKCNKCGSTFNITDGTGAPVSGPAKEKGYYLRRYTVSQASGTLNVYN